MKKKKQTAPHKTNNNRIKLEQFKTVKAHQQNSIRITFLFVRKEGRIKTQLHGWLDGIAHYSVDSYVHDAKTLYSYKQ